MEQSPSWEATYLVLQLVKKFPAFSEPEGSSPYSQVPATCPYPEPTPSSPHNPLPLPEDPRHVASSGCAWRNGLSIWRVAANKLNKQPRTADEGWSSSLGVGRGANNASPWKPMLRNIHKSRWFSNTDSKLILLFIDGIQVPLYYLR